MQINLDELKAACISRHGLVNDDLRKKIWPLLLNVETLFERDQPHLTKQINRNKKEDISITSQFRWLSEETDWKSILFSYSNAIQDILKSTESLCRFRKTSIDLLIHLIYAKNTESLLSKSYHSLLELSFRKHKRD